MLRCFVSVAVALTTMDAAALTLMVFVEFPVALTMIDALALQDATRLSVAAVAKTSAAEVVSFTRCLIDAAT